MAVLRWMTFAVLICALPLSAEAGLLEMHPRGETLPTQQQGPFITTADGEILCIDARQAHHSSDEGKTWSSVPLFKDPERFHVSDERALLRTREGTVISAWMNMKEINSPQGPKGRIWGGTPEDFSQWILPTYVCRSLDDGKTWEEPILLQRPWCGCIHSLIQTRSGRIVLVGQTIIPEWRHATIMYVSDDQGKTWQASNILDYGVGRHDHAGTCEATILERTDDSLYLLIRNESGFFYEAESTDGLKWVNFRKSNVPSVTCCGNIYRLSDGRAALLWNHPLRQQPSNRSSREELSIAFSSDDGKTWQDRTVIGTRYKRSGEGHATTRLSYPYLYERHPGELWVTTMQGGLRMKIKTADITTGEAPLPESIVLLGDSTTASRPGEVKLTTSDLLDRALVKSQPKLPVLNRGVGGNTSVDGLKRLKEEVDNLKPRLVVIRFGINDAAIDLWKTPPAIAPRVSLTDYEANLRAMVQLAQSHGAAVILSTSNPIRWTPKLKTLYGGAPYDVNAEDGFDRPVLSKYNDVVRKLARELNLPLADVHQSYLQYAQEHGVSVDSLLLDGMHPNDAGHKLSAEQLVPMIQQALDQRK